MPEYTMYVRVPVRHVDNDDDTRNDGNEYKTTNDDDCDQRCIYSQHLTHTLKHARKHIGTHNNTFFYTPKK